MEKAKCLCGTARSTCPQSHSPNSTARFCPQLGQNFLSLQLNARSLPDLFEAFVVHNDHEKKVQENLPAALQGREAQGFFPRQR
jgi:hypothetical protein